MNRGHDTWHQDPRRSPRYYCMGRAKRRLLFASISKPLRRGASSQMFEPRAREQLSWENTGLEVIEGLETPHGIYYERTSLPSGQHSRMAAPSC